MEDIKSPTPVVMSFSNSPYSGQHNHNHVAIDVNIIKELTSQLRVKDEQLKIKDEQIIMLQRIIASSVK